MAEVHLECAGAYKEMKIRRMYRYIVFRIDNDVVRIDKTGDATEGFESMVRALPHDQCRYVSYDEKESGKVYYITWTPPMSSPFTKMTYMSNRMKGFGDYEVVASDTDAICHALGAPRLRGNTEADDDSWLDD